MKSIWGNKEPPAWWKGVRNVGSVVVPVALLLFLILHQANYLIGRSLLIAFGDTESTYKSAWFEWDGDIVARDLVVYPYDLDEQYAVRAEKIHVETPGWFWFARNAFNKRRLRTQLDEVHLTLTGVVSSAGLDPTLGELGPFGGNAASPFEAEGCEVDAFWSSEELRAMGLEPGPTELEFRYTVTESRLTTTIRHETPGVSRVIFKRDEVLPRRINALLVDQYPSLVRSESWQVDDAGFTRARNRYCGAKDGAESRDVIERHVASVVRLLEMGGITVDEDTLSAYRLFTRDGGSIGFSLTYPDRTHSDDYFEMRYTGEALFVADPVLEREGARSRVRFRKTEPRELPGWEDGMTTYAALRREQGKEIMASSEVEQVARVSVKRTVARLDLEAAGERDVALDAALLEPPKPAELPSQPEPEPEPEVVAKVDPRIPWEALGEHIGHDLRVVTATSGARSVFLLEAGPEEILVRARLGGGHAEYRIKRDTFREATLIR